MSGCFSEPTDNDDDPPNILDNPWPVGVSRNATSTTLTGQANAWAIIIYDVPHEGQGLRYRYLFEAAAGAEQPYDVLLIPPAPPPPNQQFRLARMHHDLLTTPISGGGVSSAWSDDHPSYILGVVTATTSWTFTFTLQKSAGGEAYHPVEVINGTSARSWFDTEPDPTERQWTIQADLNASGWTHVQFDSIDHAPYQSFDVQFSNGERLAGTHVKLPNHGSPHMFLGAFGNEAGVTGAEYVRVNVAPNRVDPTSVLDDTLGLVHVPVDPARLAPYVMAPTYCGLRCTWP